MKELINSFILSPEILKTNFSRMTMTLFQSKLYNKAPETDNGSLAGSADYILSLTTSHYVFNTLQNADLQI